MSRSTLKDIVLAVAIGVALAAVTVQWWFA